VLGDGDGFAGDADTFTPAFHTNFLPLTTQVKSFPLATWVLPFLLQVAPAFGAAAATEITGVATTEMASVSANSLLCSFMTYCPLQVVIVVSLLAGTPSRQQFGNACRTTPTLFFRNNYLSNPYSIGVVTAAGPTKG
jgi:hypothetical protein